MTNLHAIMLPIPDNILRAAAAMLRGWSRQAQFRLGTQPGTMQRRIIGDTQWSRDLSQLTVGDWAYEYTRRPHSYDLEAARARFVQ